MGFVAQNLSRADLNLAADVLVIGGGMAAGWAAISAARAGADVVLVDKGYMGTSGVTAAGGPGHWSVPPDPKRRGEAVQRRYEASFGLADPHWMTRVIETTWENLPTIAGHYDFGADQSGQTRYDGVRGPEYMRALRQIAVEAGVRILDQSPALELLLHQDGSVAGASGVQRLTNNAWTVRSGGVILATGGCAFLSGLIGSRTNTGDGYLMAAEAGAELSGMEFSSFYTVSPLWNSTRTLIFTFARYFDEAGNELDLPPFGNDFSVDLAKALRKGRVFCSLDQMPSEVRPLISTIQPATALPFVRKGIDPYKDRFEVTLFAEGTIRGTGGLKIADASCQTTVPGLFAAGDAATRELVAGATSGGGAQNSAWALSSGIWAGEGAAATARSLGRRIAEPARALGGAGLRPAGTSKPVDAKQLIRHVQDEMLPVDKNMFRTGAGMEASLDRLDGWWRELRLHARTEGLEAVKSREAAAMLATSRWCYTAALERRESRGLHQRIDLPELDPALGRRLLVGGVDDIITRTETVAAGVGL